MKTLPSIPKSIPAHILEQVKAKGLIYVGEGVGDKSPIFGEKGEDSHYCVPYEFGAGLQYGGTMSGDGKGWHYFVTPAIAAKYFTIPKKTPAYTRGAKGRFVKKVTYPDVKNVESRPLGLVHSIKHCDKVLNGDMEALFHAFTWASAAPAGKNFQYWYEPNRGVRPLSASDLDFIRAIRDEFKARLALEEKTKAEAAAKAEAEILREENASLKARIAELESEKEKLRAAIKALNNF